MADSGEGVDALAFFVPGHPAPQGSKRHVGGGRMIESSKRVAPWRQAVALVARSNADGLIPAPVGASLHFVMPRPKSAAKSKTPPATKQNGDADKLARAVFDALTGITYGDDSHVIDFRTTKRTANIGEQSGCHITLWPIRWDEQQNREGERA